MVNWNLEKEIHHWGSQGTWSIEDTMYLHHPSMFGGRVGGVVFFQFSSAMFVNNQLAWSASCQLGFLTVLCYIDVSVSFNPLSGMHACELFSQIRSS